jgi:ribA/ribD-fused uncharacterized protein
MSISSSEELVKHINMGNSVKYIFFWGHQKPKIGINKSCFSQWYESSFISDGILYSTAEHFMMAEKAKLFSDNNALTKIIKAKEPGKAKRIGREIKNFNEETWLRNRFEIVINANLLKFEQNLELKEFLLKTGDRVLVEASPVDTIWGIGLASDNPKIEDPNAWKGLNLLGFALMVVRTTLITK